MKQRRVATLLSHLSALGAVVGAAVPFALGGDLALVEGLMAVLVGAGALGATFGVGGLLARGADWSRLATGAIAAGVAIAGLASAELLLVGPGAAGGRIWLLAPAGATLALAGVIAATADLDPVLGRPLAGLGLHRGLLGAVAAAGLVAGLSGFMLAMVVGDLVFPELWPPIGGTALVATAAAIGASEAWSRPVAAAWLPVALACLAGASATGPGAVLGLGGAVATLCCLAELGGASSAGAQGQRAGPAASTGGGS